MPTTDNRIVQMTFKNEQFERGVKESLHSLEELKKALNLDKSAESLSNLEKIAGSFDISGIAKGVEDIASRFTLLGNIGQEIFHRISRTAVDTMQNVVNTISSMPQAGFSKYEQKNKSVQMIQSAMPDKSIEEIEAVLARLNEYTDLTSYDFSTMANSIGKFVSAGVDLDVAEKVMEGIANETASAGGEIQAANIAMYNFSQALAAGSVKLMDWRSIQNQNLDTKEFKEQIIETAIAMGKLGKVSDKVGYYVKGSGKNMQQVEVDYKSFAETLSAGWFDSDVMIKVFEKYADRTSEVGKKGFEAAKIAITFTQAMDAVKDAISTGWMTSFSYLFGNLEEAGELFTGISDSLIEFVEQIYSTRNALLKGWHDGGEDGLSGYKLMIEGFSNAWEVLLGIVEAGKSAFKNVFGVLESSDLINVTKAFADFTKTIKDFFGIREEAVLVKKQIERAFDPTHSLVTVTETEQVKKYGTYLEIVSRAFRGVFSVGKGALEVISSGLTVAGRVIKVFEPLIKGSMALASGLGDVTTYVMGLASSFVKSESTLKTVDKLLKPISDVVGIIGYNIGIAGFGLSRFISVLDTVKDFGAVGDVLRSQAKFDSKSADIKYALFFYNIIDKIKNIAQNAAPAFEGLKATIGNVFTALKNFVTGAISSGLQTFETFLTNMLTAIDQGDVLTIIFNGIAKTLQVVMIVAAGAGYGIFSLAKSVVAGGTALFNFVRNSEVFQKALSSIMQFTAPLREFFSSVFNSIAAISGKIGNFKSFKDAFTAFLIAMQNNPIGKKFVPAILTAANAIGVFASRIKDLPGLIKNAIGKVPTIFNNVVGNIRGFFGNLFSGVKEFGQMVGSAFGNFFTMDTSKIEGLPQKLLARLQALAPVIDWIKDKFGSVKDVLANPGKLFGNFINALNGTIGDAKTTVGGFFNNFLPNLTVFGQKIGNAIGNLFSIDLSGIKDIPQKLMNSFQAFNPVIDWIKTKFGTLTDFLMDPNKMLSHVVGALKGIGEFVINIFKNFNLGTIWDTAKTALGTYIMLTFANSLKNFSKSIGVLTGAIDKDEKDGLGTKLRNIAITIAIVTAALAGLAFIPADKAIAGVGVMATAIGVVVGAVVLMNKFAPKTEGIGKGILSMALSIGAVLLALAGAIALVNTGGDLTKPLILIGGILVALGAVAWAMNKFGSKGKKGYSSGLAKTILAMCAGLYLIVKAVGKMSDLIKANGLDDKGESHQGRTVGAIAAIGAMLVALGVIAVLMSKFGGSGKGESATGIAATILAICNSLSTIVGAMGKVMQLIHDNPSDWGWGVGIVEGLLITVGAIAVLIAKFSNDTTFKVSLASVAPIVAMGFFLEKVVSIMGETIQKISGVDPVIIEDFLIAVGEAVGAMVGTVYAFSKIGISGLIQAAVGIVAILAAIGVGIDIAATFAADAIDKMSSALWLVGSRYASFSEFVSDIDTAKIEQVMNSLVSTILPSIGIMATYSGTMTEAKNAATEMWNFGEALGLFQDSIKDITVGTGEAIKKLPEDVKATVDAINAIQGIDAAQDVLESLGGALSLYYGNLAQMTGETVTDENGNFDINKANEAFANLADLTLDDDTLNKIKGYATGGEHDLNNFAVGIENLATALKTYGEKIGTLDEGQVKTANSIIDKVKGLDSYLNPMVSVNFDVLKGKRTSISSFGRDVAALGTALSRYGNSVSALNPVKILMANVVIDAVSTLANNLPTTGGLWQMLAGEQSLGAFAVNMDDLGSGMSNYANKVSGADFSNVDASVTAVEGLARAQSILQSNGGLKSLVEGTTGLGNLGVGLVGLGESLATFAKADGGIKTLNDADFTKIGQAIDPIKKLAEAQSILQGQDGWLDFLSGSVDLGKLGQGLQNFTTYLTQVPDMLKDFDPSEEKFVSLINLLERISAMYAIIQNGEAMTDFSSFGQGFRNLINFISEEGPDGSVMNIDTAVGNLSQLFAKLAEAVNTDTQTPEAMGTLLSNVAKKFDEHESDFESIGNKISAGIEKGMNDSQSKILAVAEVVQTVIKENAIDPATTWGSDLVTNFATGMENKISAAEEAAVAIANIIWSYLHFSTPEQGPLTDADTYGGDFLDNFVNSMMDKLPSITDTVTNVASALSNAFTGNAQASSQDFLGNLKSGLEQQYNDLINGDMPNPVISPVLDLTNIESGASEINGMLSGQSVSVGTDLAKNVMSGNGVTIIQGGAAEDHSPEIIAAINDLGDRIVSLETQMASQMSNLKVVMNTNALVGQIAPTMDRVLGGYANRR